MIVGLFLMPLIFAVGILAYLIGAHYYPEKFT
jgi:hypothetical protein